METVYECDGTTAVAHRLQSDGNTVCGKIPDWTVEWPSFHTEHELSEEDNCLACSEK